MVPSGIRVLALLAFTIPGVNGELLGIGEETQLRVMYIITCLAVVITTIAVVIAYRATRPKQAPSREGGPLARAKSAGYPTSPLIRTSEDLALQRQLTMLEAERVARQAQRDVAHDEWVQNALADTGVTSAQRRAVARAAVEHQLAAVSAQYAGLSLIHISEPTRPY